MKKQSRGIIVLWGLIAATVAGGTFLVTEHLGAGSMQASGTGSNAMAQPEDVSAQQDNSASETVSPDVAMQTFSHDGYTMDIPASWSVEQTATDTVAVHPDTSSAYAPCKIEVSAFPFPPDTDMADWISHRIGADPSLTVVEQSSEDISPNGGTGVQWTGTIDGIPTTLVYVFNASHAYEIAPSVVGEGADGSAPCSDMLQAFLSGLKI
jgi:hypothetical protein